MCGTCGVRQRGELAKIALGGESRMTTADLTRAIERLPICSSPESRDAKNGDGKYEYGDSHSSLQSNSRRSKKLRAAGCELADKDPTT